MDYFDKQNEILFQHLEDVYNIKKAKSWDDISKNITLPKVKITYRLFAKLFPRKYDYKSELEKNKSTFSSIHYSTLKANKIIDEVVRFSLYSEKIFVFHPLQNPVVTNQNIDPGRNPKYWLPDFLDALYFYIVIQKWVKAGIVKLIINPYEYDLVLRDEIDEKVNQRKERLGENKYFDLSKDFFYDHLAEQFAITYKNKSKEYIVQGILEMDTPVFTLLEANEFADRIIRAFERTNPLYKKLNIPLSNSGMLAPIKGGGPLESVMLVSELTEGNIYTPSKAHWEQIKDFGPDDFWTKFNHLYSDIPLNFLNSVDTGFALELRKEERLAGVRQQLKKMYSELNGLTLDNFSESRVKYLQENLIEEIRKAEAEWNDILKQADSARKLWLGANIGAPLIKNDFNIWAMAAVSLTWLYANEKSVQSKKLTQKIKNPISVFVDLKNQKQNFFSVLKNCIF